MCTCDGVYVTVCVRWLCVPEQVGLGEVPQLEHVVQNLAPQRQRLQRIYVFANKQKRENEKINKNCISTTVYLFARV